MGFSLDEIADLLKLTGERSCEKTRQLTEHKLADVRLRLEGLRQLELDLGQMVARFSQIHVGACCPSLDLLGHSKVVSVTRACLVHLHKRALDAEGVGVGQKR